MMTASAAMPKSVGVSKRITSRNANQVKICVPQSLAAFQACTTHERGIERFSGTGIRSRLRAFLGFDCQLRLRRLAHGMDGGLGFETVVVGEIKPYRVAAVYQSEAVSQIKLP